MGQIAALKLVEAPAFYSRLLEITEDSGGDEAFHSMHYSTQLPSSISPALAAFFVSRFSRKGQVVLDPFASSGASVLEAALMGRIAKASDIDPLALEICKAKLAPVDITEVTLRLQMINLKRPVELSSFRNSFSTFYDIDTYRELLNLRAYLQDNRDRASDFIKLLALGILHGNNAGYLSVYSHPHIALSPAEQEKVNFQRCQSADYRPVAPRILRKAAFVLREGIPSVIYNNMPYNTCSFSDARNLSYLTSSSVDLIITRPPAIKTSHEDQGQADQRQSAQRQWLKNWFLGISSSAARSERYGRELSTWKEFMNESLLEMARVLKPGGRAVLQFQSLRDGAEYFHPHEALVDVINENLSRYWEPEGTYQQKLKCSKVRKEQKNHEGVYLAKDCRALVLRRR